MSESSIVPNPASAPTLPALSDPKKDADYVFYELTRSICPECRRVIDGQVLIRDNKVYMRKRCPDHGVFEGLIYGDAQLYTNSSKFNKPGTIPLRFSTAIEDGYPHDCGLCLDHRTTTPVSEIIEVNSACGHGLPNPLFCRGRSPLQPHARRSGRYSRSLRRDRGESPGRSVLGRRAFH